MSIHNPFAFLTLLLLISFAVVNAVLITPALPAITHFFNISESMVQTVMSTYLLGYALGQLFYGPLANRFGRKPALYIGIALQIISSLICVLAGWTHQFALLAMARFTLALGAAVGLKMAFTLVNEYYAPNLVSQKISYLMLAFAVAPGLAIAAGGWLNQQYGWESCFYAGALYGLLLLLCVIKLTEAKIILDHDALKLKHLITTYQEQFKNIRLVSGGLMMGLTTCFVYVFTALAPFVAINLLNMSSKAYGVANIFPAVAYAVLAMATAQLSTKYRLQNIILAGIGILTIGVLVMFITTFLHLPALISLFIPITLIYFGEVLIYPNVSALAMHSVTDVAHASAIMSFLTIALPVIAVICLGFFPVNIYLLPLIFLTLLILIISLYGLNKIYVQL